MPCGVGACDICPVETRQGQRHLCTDGPVFDLLELI
jgi:dihydroorotate dehydrogenase electron transfer subunit